MDRLEEAYLRIDNLVARGMEINRTPGMTIALTDREETLWVATYGYANLETGTLLTKDHLFNFGSIGKSFTCILLLGGHEAGQVDLHKPVREYLPWFEIKTKYQPVTLHDLMTHSGGIPNGTDQETEALGEVWNLRDVETGFAPGEHFYYSNSGYKTLGLVLEKIYNRPYPQIVQELILNPLNMENTEPALTHAARHRFAKGYTSLYDDRPSHRSHPLVPTPWLESATGDGCISSNAEDLAKYARMLLNRGRGPHGQIFSEESFKLMTRPLMQRQKRHYGYGIEVYERDGYQHIGHGGSIPGYLAFLDMDMDNGLGVVILMAGPGIEEVRFSIMKLLRAGILGEEWPESPFKTDLMAVDNGDDYTGEYTCEHYSFNVILESQYLWLEYGGERKIMEPRGVDRFYVDHPDFHLFLLKFGRGDSGEVQEAFLGEHWYIHNRYQGEKVFDFPAGWRAYTGHYRSHNPWSTNFRIILRKGCLLLVHPDGTGANLVPQKDGSFLAEYEDQPVSCERVRFGAIADGKAIHVKYSVADYYRFFTP